MNFKQRITAGECLLGACIYSNSPQIIECGAVGMDWIWWDAQHTHGDWSTIAHGVCTANLMTIPALIRTWTHDPGTLERLLAPGATKGDAAATVVDVGAAVYEEGSLDLLQ